jgi:hypothetical protein
MKKIHWINSIPILLMLTLACILIIGCSKKIGHTQMPYLEDLVRESEVIFICAKKPGASYFEVKKIYKNSVDENLTVKIGADAAIKVDKADEKGATLIVFREKGPSRATNKPYKQMALLVTDDGVISYYNWPITSFETYLKRRRE